MSKGRQINTFDKDYRLNSPLVEWQTGFDLSGNEFICKECREKCTIGKDGETEYGHYRECEHSIRQWISED
jgi:hypothetical protein